jgi:hypothetical protein
MIIAYWILLILTTLVLVGGLAFTFPVRFRCRLEPYIAIVAGVIAQTVLKMVCFPSHDFRESVFLGAAVIAATAFLLFVNRREEKVAENHSR